MQYAKNIFQYNNYLLLIAKNNCFLYDVIKISKPGYIIKTYFITFWLTCIFCSISIFVLPPWQQNGEAI